MSGPSYSNRTLQATSAGYSSSWKRIHHLCRGPSVSAGSEIMDRFHTQ